MEHWNKIKELQNKVTYDSWVAYLEGDKNKHKEMIKNTTNEYSFHLLLQMRYINMKKIIKPELDYDKIVSEKPKTKKPLAHIISSLDSEQESGFETFRTNEKYKLLVSLRAIFGEGFDWSWLKYMEKQIKFSLLDFGFFMYLLDSFEDKNMRLLRKQQFDLIDVEVLRLIKSGARDLLLSHKTTISKDEFEKREEYVFGRNSVILNNSIMRLRATLDRIKGIENTGNVQWLLKAMNSHIIYSNEYLTRLLREKDTVVDFKLYNMEEIEFDL